MLWPDVVAGAAARFQRAPNRSLAKRRAAGTSSSRGKDADGAAFRREERAVRPVERRRDRAGPQFAGHRLFPAERNDHRPRRRARQPLYRHQGRGRRARRRRPCRAARARRHVRQPRAGPGPRRERLRRARGDALQSAAARHHPAAHQPEPALRLVLLSRRRPQARRGVARGGGRALRASARRAGRRSLPAPGGVHRGERLDRRGRGAHAAEQVLRPVRSRRGGRHPHAHRPPERGDPRPSADRKPGRAARAPAGRLRGAGRSRLDRASQDDQAQQAAGGGHGERRLHRRPRGHRPSELSRRQFAARRGAHRPRLFSRGTRAGGAQDRPANQDPSPSGREDRRRLRDRLRSQPPSARQALRARRAENPSASPVASS